MDTGYTYADKFGARLSVYVPPGFEPPKMVETRLSGEPVAFMLLEDSELSCGTQVGKGKPKDGCGKFDCHRMDLGRCQCGTHRAPVRFRRS